MAKDGTEEIEVKIGEDKVKLSRRDALFLSVLHRIATKL